MNDGQTETRKESPGFEAAATLDRMSAACTLNAGPSFSGAIIIIPPGDGKPIELLLLDNRQDPALFWGTVKSYVDTAIADLQEAERNGGQASGAWSPRR